MKYYSTNKLAPIADFKEATIRGQAPDKGLYFPEQIPALSASFLHSIDTLSKEEVSFEVIRPFVGDSIPDDRLFHIVRETVNFDFPLKPINDHIGSLELFHGPTLAFKDVGARFMSRCLSYFARGSSRKIVVLVATSGDTGGAVANGFYNIEGIDVVILYPSGKVSKVQEQQLTTLGNNVHALEVQGTFDDCQQMVKRAFADTELTERLFLTSANSINVSRWLPQQFYYFFAWQQWKQSNPPVIAVPSGNFGNICAGLVAHKRGLPVRQFIAACNANDVVPRFFNEGVYEPRPATATLSNAMDVGNPSNFIRILELFDNNTAWLKQVVTSYSISDDDTRETIRRVFDSEGYLLDPHAAVAYTALSHYLDEHGEDKGYVLETAHPIKFFDVVEPIIGRPIPMPLPVAGIMEKQKQSLLVGNDYRELKAYLNNAG